MALEIKNAPGRHGYAHLVFDRDIDVGSLRISIYDLMKREYLGHSVARANWTPARCHYFAATLVERAQGRTTFLIGPEVTTFIPDETTIEVTSEDLAVSAKAVWRGILMDFHWKGSETEADEQEANRRREKEAKNQSLEQGRREREEEEESRERAAKAKRLAEEERQPLDAETKRLESERIRRENGAKAAALLAMRTTEPRSYTKPMASLVAFVIFAGALFWGSQNRGFLCDQFNLFCPADMIAYRKAVTCAKMINCGALACIAEYRVIFPQGHFKTQIDRIATEKGRPCIDEVELAAFNSAKSCADLKTCGARECFADYRRDYPNGPHKDDIDRLDAQKGVACPDIELQMFERAKACAAPMICGAEPCLAEYRRSYPSGRFKAEIDRIATEKSACRNPELEVVERAEACARPLSCGVEAACLTEYRRSYPNGTFKARIDRLAAEKGQTCRDLESEAYQRAEQCASRLTNCGASSCLTEYRRDFPNGRYKAQIDQIDALKGRTCQQTTPLDTLPPFNPRPPGQDAGLNCSQLRNPELIEEMICADADLARANSGLQRTWERLAPSRQQRLRQEQRDWIARRDNECNVPRSGAWDQMTLRRLKSCVISKTRARNNELQ